MMHESLFEITDV